jgi:release factor glutamine methyltransferase
LKALDPVHAQFDLIASNPPYVSKRAYGRLQREVREHEPRLALVSVSHGLGMIRQLVREAPRYLRTGGHLLLEIGFDQDEAVSQMIDPRIWTLLAIRKDLQGLPRTVVLRKE